MNKDFIIDAFQLQPLNSGPFTIPTIVDIDETVLAIQSGQKSYFGTPVFSDCQIQNNTADLSVYMDAILIDLVQSKNIVRTAINGRNGTVKEYISDGDYSISIKGVLVGNDGNYPKDLVSQMISICQLPESLEITCPFLQLFGVFNIVIESYVFAQKEGFSNLQAFELSCISDQPIELIADV